MRHGVLESALVALALVGLACGGAGEAPEPDAEPDTTAAAGDTAPRPAGGPVDAAGLVDTLRTRGLAVEPAGAITQPFFAPRGEVYAVEGLEVQVYEYPDAAAADRAAATVAPDGSAVGSTMVEWSAPPHFYRSGRLLVVYLGSDPRVGETLAAVLGPPFAER